MCGHNVRVAMGQCVVEVVAAGQWRNGGMSWRGAGERYGPHRQ